MNTRDSASRPTEATIERVLQSILDSAGVELDSSRRQRQGGSRATGLEWLAAQTRQAGLRASVVSQSIDAALDQWDAGHPLVAPIDGDDDRWISIVRVGARKVEVRVFDRDGRDSTSRMTRRALRALLDKKRDEKISWLATEAASAASNVGGSSPMRPFQRMMRLLQPDRGEIWTVVVFAIATGVLLLATPIAVQALVNFVAFGGAIPPLVVVALLLLLGLGFAAALTATQTWIVEILQRRIFVRTVADLATRLPRVTLEARGHGYGPELVNRFFDIMTIQKVGSTLLLDGLGVLLSVLVGLAVLAFYHPLLLAFDILLLVVIAALVFGPVRGGISSAIKESKAKYAVAAWLEEIARGPLTFKTAGAEQWVFAESDRLARGYVESRRSHYRVVFGQVLGGLMLQVFASTGLLTVGGFLVINGSLTLGQLVAAELIVTLVVSSVAKMGKHLESFYDLMAAVDKVGQLLDLPTESPAGELPAVTARPAAVTLDDVRWSSTSGSGIQLELPPGGRLGIFGETGSGKTRLLESLWGLHRPETGSIRIDGRDLRELAPEYLRRVVSLSSSVEIISGTVAENVHLGRSFVSDDDVRAALEKVGLLSVYSELPEGINTRIASDGYPLSAGQVQSLAIARAIASRPNLLLVDGSLDGLSHPNQELLLDALLDPEAPWTLVLTSHLPEVLERCESVLYLPEGRVESRSPEMLTSS